MAPVDKALLSGSEVIPIEDLQKLEIRNYSGAVDYALQQFKWNGRAAGCLVLQLSPDNADIAAGQFVARGRLAREDVKVEANKLWAEADNNTILTIKVPDGGAFTFGDGGLCSDYLDNDQLEYQVGSGGRGSQTIPQAEYGEKGIGAFCVRMVCHLTRVTVKSGVILTYTVLVFPGSAEEVESVSELAQSPSWPGLKLVDGELTLLPLATSKWGCPVIPLLLTGSPWEDECSHPPFKDMRTKIDWILTTSEPPDVCKTRKALLSKWQRYAQNPDEFVTRRSPLTWPKPQQSVQTGGLNTVNV
jgi:hypothetical protein